MKISIDRTLPISLHAQIVGAIEYGIMAGSFQHDATLPSVRGLSRELGVSQLTISHAYSALKTMGLIETIPGKGTYVVGDHQAQLLNSQTEDLRQRFQQLLADGEALGISPAFFINLMHQETPTRLELPCRVAFVGNSNRANRRYLSAIQETLNISFCADSYTFDEFDGLSDKALLQYALYITIPHCISRVRQRLNDSTPVYAPYLIPSEETRRQLASLPEDISVLLVSCFENFIPTMCEGVKNFAPHLGKIKIITPDDDTLLQEMDAHDVVIYSTSCHNYLQRLPSPALMFEYRHIPESRYLRDILSPALYRYAQRSTELQG